MSDGDNFSAGFGFAAAVAVLVGVPSCAGCHNMGQRDVRSEAVERGLGEYRVDQKSQGVQFHWTVKAVDGAVQVERNHPSANILVKP